MPCLLTRHAAQRCRQRGIPLDIVDTIHAYGTTYRSRAATGFLFDRAALAWAASDLDPATVRNLERYVGTYLIMSDEGILITAARQTRRRFH